MAGCIALGKQVSIIKAVPGSTQKTKRMSLSYLNPEWAGVHSYGENQVIRLEVRLAGSHSESDALPGTVVTIAPTAFHNIAVILFCRGTTTGRITPNPQKLPLLSQQQGQFMKCLHTPKGPKASLYRYKHPCAAGLKFGVTAPESYWPVLPHTCPQTLEMGWGKSLACCLLDSREHKLLGQTSLSSHTDSTDKQLCHLVQAASPSWTSASSSKKWAYLWNVSSRDLGGIHWN